MICTKAFPFVEDFIGAMNEELGKIDSEHRLSRIQTGVSHLNFVDYQGSWGADLKKL